jgi:hypothetical protein
MFKSLVLASFLGFAMLGACPRNSQLTEDEKEA